ncbi:hypothetical protein Mapa_004122 [Marchantia paleacea]|nr:hypothetical protein Mapa_004122 [Marchantia paleacea]
MLLAREKWGAFENGQSALLLIQSVVFIVLGGRKSLALCDLDLLVVIGPSVSILRVVVAQVLVLAARASASAVESIVVAISTNFEVAIARIDVLPIRIPHGLPIAATDRASVPSALLMIVLARHLFQHMPPSLSLVPSCEHGAGHELLHRWPDRVLPVLSGARHRSRWRIGAGHGPIVRGRRNVHPVRGFGANLITVDVDGLVEFVSRDRDVPSAHRPPSVFRHEVGPGAREACARDAPHGFGHWRRRHFSEFDPTNQLH